MNVFEILDDRLDKTVELVVDDILEEGKRFSTFPKTTDQIVYSHAGIFVNSLTLNQMAYYLVHLKAQHENDDEGDIAERAETARRKFMSALWDVQDLVDEVIKERL